MRRILIVFLALLMCTPAVFARKKKEKSGKIVDGVFTDKKYNFRMNIDSDWKPIIKKNKDNYRLVLTQTNYEIPPDYQDAPDFTMVPRLVVYVGESPMTPFAFLDSLLSDSYKSDFKKDLLKEFEILNAFSLGTGEEREKAVTRKRKSVKIAGTKGVLWEAKSIYIKYVTLSQSSQGNKRIYGAYKAGVVIVKNGDNLYLFHAITEEIYFPQVWAEALTMIMSLEFIE